MYAQRNDNPAVLCGPIIAHPSSHRYVPDEVSFDDTPTDSATPATVDMQAYKPLEFVTDVSRGRIDRGKLVRPTRAESDPYLDPSSPTM